MRIINEYEIKGDLVSPIKGDEVKIGKIEREPPLKGGSNLPSEGPFSGCRS